MQARFALGILAPFLFLLAGSLDAAKKPGPDEPEPTASTPSAADLEANPLLKAVVQDDEERVRASLGVNVNRRDSEKMTPLHWVRSSEVARILIGAGADLSARDELGATPLHFVGWSKFTDVQLIQTLIEKGADINARDNSESTPLHWAAWHCADANVKTLLHSGATPTKQDSNKMTPLEVWKHRCPGEDVPFEEQ